MSEQQLFRLQAIVRYDEKYEVWVAQCLETGSLVTADDSATVQGMLLELLDDEAEFTMKYANLRNFFGSPAPLDDWLWFKTGQPQEVSRPRYRLEVVRQAEKLGRQP